MNDYTFGNKILERRTELNLSQAELAEKVGVSNKAVSKWETGRSKPTTNVLRKLAALFHMEVEEMLCMREQETKMKISAIKNIVTTKKIKTLAPALVLEAAASTVSSAASLKNNSLEQQSRGLYGLIF